MRDYAQNTDELLIRYMDGDLSEQEEREVRELLHENPALMQELRQFEQSRLRPDESITFANKESLFRPLKTSRPALSYYTGAAAAAVLLAAALFYYTFSNVNVEEGTPAGGPVLSATQDPAAPGKTAAGVEEMTIARKDATQQDRQLRPAQPVIKVQEDRKNLMEAVTLNRGVWVLLPPPVLERMSPARNYMIVKADEIPLKEEVPGRLEKFRSKALGLGNSVLVKLTGKIGGTPRFSLLKEEIDDRKVYTLTFENNRVKYIGKF